MKKLRWGGVIQKSGKTVNDFNCLLKYTLDSRHGNKGNVYVKVLVDNGIPKIEIETEGGRAITSKDEYVDAIIRIVNNPINGPLISNAKVCGRGNATWKYPKKPYKVKFETKEEPFGFPANKKWVLLADACDRSLLRTAYMCEVSKSVGIDYTINYQYAELYLNKEYLGIYLFTDHVEKSKNRIQIDDDGYLIELDSYYLEEPLYFTTDSLNYYYTFKYPNANDKDIVKDDEKYHYIKDFMNRLESSLLLLNNDSTNEDFTKYIDIKSFSKWYMAAEITATYDPNIYLVLPSRTSKLKMMPLWDAEWSMGLWAINEFGEPPAKMYEYIFWKSERYFRYLMKSPAFKNQLKIEWQLFRNKIQEVKDRILFDCELLTLPTKSNFEKWPSNDFQPLNISFSSWSNEVQYINEFYDKRVIFLDSYFNSL